MVDITDDLFEHRRRFLLVVMLSGVTCAIVFLLSHLLALNTLTSTQFIATSLFVGIALPAIAVLWRFPRFYPFAVWGYDVITLGLFLSALLTMPQDELRVIWFFLLVAGTFSLIGTRAGWANLLVSIVAVLIANAAGYVHYSGNAIATFAICLIASGAFFHAANRQVMSFIRRIRQTTHTLEHASRTDALTGLANNRALEDAWEEMAATNRPIGFLFLDVDHFKTVNDNLGHASGDLVLKTIAEALKTSLDETAMAGRIGGEEFAVLLPDADLERALAVAEAIRAAIEDSQPVIDGHSIVVTTSVGVAVSHAPHPPQGLVKRAADAALYRAKTLGRNRVVAAATEYDPIRAA